MTSLLLSGRPRAPRAAPSPGSGSDVRGWTDGRAPSSFLAGASCFDGTRLAELALSLELPGCPPRWPLADLVLSLYCASALVRVRGLRLKDVVASRTPTCPASASFPVAPLGLRKCTAQQKDVQARVGRLGGTVDGYSRLAGYSAVLPVPGPPPAPRPVREWSGGERRGGGGGTCTSSVGRGLRGVLRAPGCYGRVGGLSSSWVAISPPRARRQRLRASVSGLRMGNPSVVRRSASRAPGFGGHTLSRARPLPVVVAPG